MRSAYLPVFACTAMILLDSSASAQQAAPSVEGYLCTFAGKCGDVPEVEQPTRPAPATKGFRIAKPRAETAAVTTGRRPGRGPATSASYVRPARANAASAAAYRPSASSSYSAARGADAPRADLMIGFELNSARITGDGMAKARIFAESLLMPELRGKRFLIEGHTDSLGGVPFNMELSRRRAEAVASYLAQQGVERSRVEVRGFGPSIPLPGRATTDPHNRRVEAKLIS